MSIFLFYLQLIMVSLLFKPQLQATCVSTSAYLLLSTSTSPCFYSNRKEYRMFQLKSIFENNKAMQTHFHFLVSPTDRLSKFIRTTVSWQSGHSSLWLQELIPLILWLAYRALCSAPNKGTRLIVRATPCTFHFSLCCWGWWSKGRNQASEDLKINLNRLSAPAFPCCASPAIKLKFFFPFFLVLGSK